MATKSIRLQLPEEVEKKAKDLYKRLYPRHKYDAAILFEELIDTADQVKQKLKTLEDKLKALEALEVTDLNTNDTV